MKTQAHYTTPIATTPWMRRNLAALMALLGLAAALVGLIFALGGLSDSAQGGAVGEPARPLLATCRACADETLGAAQLSQASLTHQAMHSPTLGRIASPRAFRDEVLGADQANLAFLSIQAAQRPSETARVSTAPIADLALAAPRAFRDEVLGADQANLASLTISRSAGEPQQNDVLRAGPR